MKKLIYFVIGLVVVIAGVFAFTQYSHAAGCAPFLVASGGTGVCAIVVGDIPFGNGTSKIATSSSLFWTTALNRLSFTNGSSTNQSVGTNLWLNALGTPAGAFLAVDANGKVIATTTPSSGGTPGGADTDIQFNNADSFGGDSAFTFDVGSTQVRLGAQGTGGDLFVGGTRLSEASLTAPRALNDGDDGDSFTVSAGNGAEVTGTGAGGDINLNAGGGGETSGNGGGINITAGNAVAGDDNGGNVLIVSGVPHGSGSAGNVSIEAENETAYLRLTASASTYTVPAGSIALEANSGHYYFGASGASVLSAILDASAISSSDKTFSLPNTSGTFCLTTTCASFGYPFTYATTFNTLSAATTTPVWFQGNGTYGLFASSTSIFNNASTTQLSIDATGKLYIPHASNVTFTGASQVAVDDTIASSSIHWTDVNNVEHAVFASTTVSFTYATTTPAGTTTIQIAGATRKVIYTSIGCSSVGGTANIQLGNYTASTTMVTSATTNTTTFTTLSSNNTFGQGQVRYFDIGTFSAATVKQVSCSLMQSYDPN